MNQSLGDKESSSYSDLYSDGQDILLLDILRDMLSDTVQNEQVI